jgi:cytosine/adenosine deaminase-related metal-dependent hydrolase
VAPIDDGAVAIRRGLILDAGHALEIIKKYPSYRIYSLNKSVLMPGLINVHAHLELPALPSPIKAKSFPEWVLSLIKVKRSFQACDYQRTVQRNLTTLAKSGTTTIGEICTHNISPAYLRQSRIRSFIFREIISMASDQKIISDALLARSSSLQRHGLSPHTPYTVSEHALRQIMPCAKKSNIRLAMHIAESKDEIKLLQRKKSGLEKIYEFAKWDLDWAPRGASSFEYLNRIGFLSSDLLAVHAVQVTDKDIDLIKKSKTSVAHCPRSNKELGVGKMPLKKFLDAGITVGLGTDSLASVPNLNMWDEMRYAYQIHRRDGVSPEDIFKLATIGGAKALGLGKEIGTLEPGKRADMIAVPLPKKNTGNLYSDLLRETKSCIMTMVNGKILYRE